MNIWNQRRPIEVAVAAALLVSCWPASVRAAGESSPWPAPVESSAASELAGRSERAVFHCPEPSARTDGGHADAIAVMAANSTQTETLPAGNATQAAAPTIAAPAAEPRNAADLDAIMQRLEALEKSLAKPSAETKSAAEQVPEITWTDLSADKWTVKLGGHMQLDSINWADASPTIPEFNYIEFRRLRLLADGEGYGVYDFRLQIDVEPESGNGVNTPVTDIKDAYLTMKELPYVFRKARIGNFFVPFGLEQVTNDTNNVFLERSIPTQGIFTGDREIGFAFYGASADLNTTWTTGFFADSVSESLKERIDDNQGQRFSGRLTHLLYYDEPSNGRYLFHTGIGILHTLDQDDLVRFRARPQIHEGPFLIDTGPMPAKTHTSANLELATVWGPLTVQSEWFLTNVDLEVGGNTLSWGGYLHGSYFLTGENRIYDRFGQHGAQFTRSQPYSNFFLTPGGWGPGAWEIKGRWSNLSLNEYGAGQYNDFTFGFNWYWSNRIRVMFDWIHPFTTAETVFGQTQADIIGMRMDYNF